MAAIALCVWIAWAAGSVALAGQQESRVNAEPRDTLLAGPVGEEQLRTVGQLIAESCLDCHSTGGAEAGLDLEAFVFDRQPWLEPDFDTQPWETVLRRIQTRQMPPPSSHRPDESTYQAAVEALSWLLDQRSMAFPRTVNTSAMRRLTRYEYQSSIRDLLGLQIDAAEFLPRDESSHGFDNITVSELSPTHLNRYLAAAQTISRAALGGRGNGPVGITIRQPADRSQERHVPGLPFGTRGGLVFQRHVHRSGEYEIEIKLTRDRDEKIEGLNRSYPIDVLVDRQRRHRFTIQPIRGSEGWEGADHTHADSHLKTRLDLTAGTHSIGITFPKLASSLSEGNRQPFDANFNRHRHPRLTPAIYQVSLVGPLGDSDRGNTRSHRLIFGEAFDFEHADRQDAANVLRRLASRAYRRPADQQDLDLLMEFFDSGRSGGDFATGIQAAVSAILANPNFLFRIESRPEATEPGRHAVTDFELASRLSYFLWSSLPDAPLSKLAAENRLQDNATLLNQVDRMLDGPRSAALVENFASQWLYLRNLDSITPDLRAFPDFDDNLRQSFRQETEHLFADVLNRDRSVLSLIRSDTTFLNQRLARHYGIPGVQGSRFRPVKVAPESHRGGLLRHGSILMVTSYATRTSPTIRGNWVLKNILGTPAPPPPPDVPNLKENTPLEFTSVRERLAAHRANPACASCHDLMDPVGFALENFDAVGRWRHFEGSVDVDASGQLPDGTEVHSVAELERGILSRPAVFAQTVTEKLMIYALGRPLEVDDLPAVRRIVDRARADDYTLRSLIRGIASSEPFRTWSRD